MIACKGAAYPTGSRLRSSTPGNDQEWLPNATPLHLLGNKLDFSNTLLVPDNFSEAQIIPITSNICFAAGYKSQQVEQMSVSHINSLALANAEKYVFAKNLENCTLE